eukprot:Awhi_evm1s1424
MHSDNNILAAITATTAETDNTSNVKEKWPTDGIHKNIYYNLGDLLNMPSFLPSTSRPKEGRLSSMKRAKEMSKVYKNSILSRYVELEPIYKNKSCVSLGIDDFEAYEELEKNYTVLVNKNSTKKLQKLLTSKRYANFIPRCQQYPDVSLLSTVVDELGRRATKRKKLRDFVSLVQKPTTLTVHLRSGDKGTIGEGYGQIIRRMSKRFTDILFIGGVHSTGKFRSIEQSEKTLSKDTNMIRRLIYGSQKNTGNNTNIEIPELHFRLSAPSPTHGNSYLSRNADFDIYLFKKASSLLVHRGGYSALGALLNENTVFYDKRLFKYNVIIDDKGKNIMPWSTFFEKKIITSHV